MGRQQKMQISVRLLSLSWALSLSLSLSLSVCVCVCVCVLCVKDSYQLDLKFLSISHLVLPVLHRVQACTSSTCLTHPCYTRYIHPMPPLSGSPTTCAISGTSGRLTMNATSNTSGQHTSHTIDAASHTTPNASGTKTQVIFKWPSVWSLLLFLCD